MSEKDPKFVVLQFNECINNRDLEGLSNLMTEGHVFIDNNNDVHRGKELMVKGWEDFFRQFPDYSNHFAIVESRGDQVVVIGHSTCSFKPLDGPALWTATVEDGLIAEWRVYLDTVENREDLDLKTDV
ncbi:MAG: nuclear transport factor 2 family protein [Chloracidobacterium sp.]|nr:nuclear transport factor 2 family protein [Chloracidobacterium sp.]